PPAAAGALSGGGPVDVTTRGTTPERSPTPCPSPSVASLNGGVPRRSLSWRRPACRMIPHRWLSVHVTSAVVRREMGRGSLPRPVAQGTCVGGAGPLAGGGVWDGADRPTPTARGTCGDLDSTEPAPARLTDPLA